MKSTRHRYHYAVCKIQRNKFKIQKEKLAESINDTQRFWSEILKIKPANRKVAQSISGVTGDRAISESFASKYTLYNSGPTSGTNLI